MRNGLVAALRVVLVPKFVRVAGVAGGAISRVCSGRAERVLVDVPFVHVMEMPIVQKV